MDAIFLNDYSEPITRFDSYMERASLQLKVELEEYVESTFNTSSSSFISEATHNYKERLITAIKTIIEKIKQFIQDTKKNFQKYFSDKKRDEKINRIAKACKLDKKLANLSVKYKDFSPKARFIESEKIALSKLFKSKNTTKDDLRLFYSRHKTEFKMLNDVKNIILSVSGVALTAKTFVDGFKKGYQNLIDSQNDTLKELDELSHVNYIFESTEEKEEISDNAEMVKLYIDGLYMMVSEELELQKEMLSEYDKCLSELDSKVKENIM